MLSGSNQVVSHNVRVVRPIGSVSRMGSPLLSYCQHHVWPPGRVALSSSRLALHSSTQVCPKALQ